MTNKCIFLVYLFVPNQLYMFRAMFSSIIRSTWLYLQLLVMFTDIAAGRSQERDGTEFHLVHDTGRQQHRWTKSEAVNTVMCSWWWAKPSSETCWADWVQINKPKFVPCWSSITSYTNDAQTYKQKNSKLFLLHPRCKSPFIDNQLCTMLCVPIHILCSSCSETFRCLLALSSGRPV